MVSRVHKGAEDSLILSKNIKTMVALISTAIKAVARLDPLSVTLLPAVYDSTKDANQEGYFPESSGPHSMRHHGIGQPLGRVMLRLIGDHVRALAATPTAWSSFVSALCRGELL